MPSGRPISNDRLYDALNSMRLELKSDIGDLRRQFETLEAGRLTRLEGKMSDFEVSQAKKDANLDKNQAILSTKFVIIGGIGMTILDGLIFFILQKVAK